MGRGIPGDSGGATIDYVGVLALVATVLVLVAGTFTSAGAAVVQGATCRATAVLSLGEECPDLQLPGSTSAVDARVQDLLDQADDLALFAGSGQATQDLLDEAQRAIEAGQLDRAQALLDQLSLYEDLARTDPRGQYLANLFGASDQEYEALMAEGTIYYDGGSYNTSYFQLDDAPGGGVVVMDYFIDSATSGGVLAGDDRDHADPLRGDLDLHESRMMLVVDLETGRGQVLVTETCTAHVRTCNEPRPNVFDGSIWSNDTGTSPVIPILPNDYDIANQFTFSGAENGFQLHYDALNGIIPVGSVDGTISVHVGDDGQLVIGEDDRDNYPSIGTYYYSEPGETQVVQQTDQESVLCGALPVNLC